MTRAALDSAAFGQDTRVSLRSPAAATRRTRRVHAHSTPIALVVGIAGALYALMLVAPLDVERAR